MRFQARVRTGNITSAEFSVDGGAWMLVFPIDGIADSAMEEYRIVIPAGEHLVGILASDLNGTTGVVISVP